MNSKHIKYRLVNGIKHIVPEKINFIYIALALITAPIFLLIINVINISQDYTQLTAGLTTWSNYNKIDDYLLILIYTIGFIVSYFILSYAAKRSIYHETYYKYINSIAYCCIPFAIWAGNCIFSQSINLDLLLLASTLIIFCAIAYSLNHNKDELFLSSFLCTAFFIASIFAVNLLLVRFFGADPFIIQDLHQKVISYHFFYILIPTLSFFVILYLFFNTRTLLILLQLPLSLFYILFIPALFSDGNELVQLYSVNNSLYYFTIVIIFVSCVDIIRRFSYRKMELSLAVSPMALLAALVFLKSNLTGAPAISQDDYHFGEWLVPFWSWLQFNALPFVDYAPARGLINYTDGFIAHIFFNLDASNISIVRSTAVICFFYLSILFVTSSLILGKLIAFILCLIISTNHFGVLGIDIVNTSIVFLLLYFLINKKYSAYITLTPILGIIAVLFAPGQGGILILALTPISIYILYKCVKDHKNEIFKFIIPVLVIFTAIIFITPLFDMLKYAIIYAAEQSSINTFAYGRAWLDSIGRYEDGNYWLFEIMRSGFIFVLCFSAIIFIVALLNKNIRYRKEILVVSSIVLITSILFIVRAAGRIDVGRPSRLGLTTMWLFATYLPFLFYFLYGKEHMGKACVGIAFFLGLYGYPANSLSLENMYRKAGLIQGVPNNLVKGEDIGIPNIGLARMNEEHKDRLVALKKILDQHLDDHETYLDLTNRHAHYFYFERKPPIETGAFYNLVSDGQQERAVLRLFDDPPKIALIDADGLYHDVVRAGLRSHMLYRFLLQNYQPVQIGKYGFMLRNDYFTDFEPKPGITEQLSILDRAFSQSNLRSLPMAWGDSWKTLSTKMNEIFVIDLTQAELNDLEITPDGLEAVGTKPFMLITLPPFPGHQAGLLSFDYTCLAPSDPSEFRIEFGAGSHFHPGHSVSYTASTGRHIIPLDANPRYLLESNISSLRISFPGKSTCSRFTIDHITLSQRSNADLPTLFENSYTLQGLKPVPGLFMPAQITDRNWTYGISELFSGFVMYSQEADQLSLTVGALLDVGGTEATIQKIEKRGQYTHVHLDTDITPQANMKIRLVPVE